MAHSQIELEFSLGFSGEEPGLELRERPNELYSRDSSPGIEPETPEISVLLLRP